METQYRIVFSGRVHDGLDPSVVRAAVAARLSANSLQLERIFSGKLVVLKNGLHEAEAKAYLSRLERLGMAVKLEKLPDVTVPEVAVPVVPVVPVVPEPRVVVPVVTSVDTPVVTPSEIRVPAVAGLVPPSRLSVQEASAVPAIVTNPAEDTWLSGSSFADLARTQINLTRAEALLNGHEEESSEGEDAEGEPGESGPGNMPQISAPIIIPPEIPQAHVVMSPQLAPDNTFLLSGTFTCSHCGGKHHLNANILIKPVG